MGIKDRDTFTHCQEGKTDRTPSVPVGRKVREVCNGSLAWDGQQSEKFCSLNKGMLQGQIWGFGVWG